VRLFVALDLPDTVREKLRDLTTRLSTQSSAVRWVRPEAMHITLKFIGETDPTKVDTLHTALNTIHSPQPVEMTFHGVGFFPNERQPRALWCGVKALPNLPKLAEVIEHALEPLGFPAESREFVPHLTLARFSSQKGAQEVVRAANEFKSRDFGSTAETEFHLMESHLKSSGAEYNRLASFAFVKGAA
jgi:RNA 2',3'-cyclic 3'-phosphodiesterase